jgi:acyl-CoA thioesterase
MDNLIIKFFENDKFAALCGAKLIDVEQGKAVARLNISPMHINAAGGVQGGAIFTLCDFAFAAATNSYGSLTVGVSSSIQYFSQPKGQYIMAIAGETFRGRKLCGCTVDVFDEDGTIIARFMGTGYIKGDKLKFE